MVWTVLENHLLPLLDLCLLLAQNWTEKNKFKTFQPGQPSNHHHHPLFLYKYIHRHCVTREPALVPKNNP